MRSERPSHPGGGPHSGASDRELIAAMRLQDPAAYHEFILRHHSLLLSHARYLRIPSPQRDDYVIEVLGDVAMSLARTEAPITRSLTAYVITAFRRRFFNGRRDRLRRERLIASVAEDASGAEERVVASTCSEDALRSSRGPDYAFIPLHPAVERLATMLDEQLSEDEQQLLGWVSHHVPYSEIASWLGLERQAVVMRVWRLRERLKDAAGRFERSFDPVEQEELRRFFRRTSPRQPNSMREGGMKAVAPATNAEDYP